MNLRKFLLLATLACTAVGVSSAANSTSSGSTAGEITVTKEQLEALIAELKTQIASDPDLAAIFDSIDLDALLKLTPEEAREELNKKIFDATAAPTTSGSTGGSKASGSSSGAGNGTATTPPSSDNVGSNEPKSTVPAPTPASAASSLPLATVSAVAAVIVTVYAA